MYICNMKQRKLIDISMEAFKNLTQQAKKQGRSLKNYIEYILEKKGQK